jgi:hypothetical protein
MKASRVFVVLGGVLGAGLLAGSAGAEDDAELAAQSADAIVGIWVGKGNHGNGSEFSMKLTFVSPKGGVSRYPDIPCGGMLVGGRKGTSYEYAETVTYNGAEERADNFCISGVMRLTVKGNAMSYDWSSMYNGEEHVSTGTLKRVGAR